MKILLVVPPYRTSDALTTQLFPMPLGPVYVGTMLREQGHTVHLEDFLVPHQQHTTPAPACYKGLRAPAYIHYGRPLEECLDWLTEHAPDYDAVGLACCQCVIWETVQAIAHHVKDLGLPLVGGGPFVTTATDEAFDKFKLDVAVQYEGEWVAEEAFQRAIAGETGVVLNGGDGVRDITKTPIPDWTLAPPTNYPQYNGRTRGVLTISRGCPWTCEFCSVFTIMSRKHRRQDKGRIKAELASLWGMGVRYFCFLDDNLFISLKAADVLLEAVAELDQEIKGFKRAKFYVEEGIEVRMAAKPGFMRRLAETKRWENLAIGLETASAKNAKTVNKPYTADDLDKAVMECRAAGVTTKAFYIIGFPHDTLHSVARDVVTFATYGMSARPNNLKLYPGTPTTAQFLENGWIKPGYDWRLSTFHTPDHPGMAYADIQKMKVILRAVGMAQDQFGIDPFTDNIHDVFDKLRAKKYEVTVHDDGLTLTGNMFRPTPYRVLAEILACRVHDAKGATGQTGKNEIVAVTQRAPRDKYQGAILAAMRGEQPRPVGFGLSN